MYIFGIDIPLIETIFVIALFLLVTMIIPIIYSLSFLPDIRYSYFVFPILIVVSLFTIKNIHSKIKNNNLKF